MAVPADDQLWDFREKDLGNPSPCRLLKNDEKSMTHPLISIVLPTFNSLRFLKERMESILGQDYGNWELIVCDSHSDDGTWEYFQQFKNDARVRLYQVPREGLFAGWNECLRRVRGQFFYVATSDDTAFPTLLNRLSSALLRFPDVKIANCGFDYIDDRGDKIPPTQVDPGLFYGEWRKLFHRRSGWVDFLVHTELGTSWTTITSTLFCSSLLHEVGLFREDMEPGEAFADRFWAMKSALCSDTLYIPEHLATWRVHGAQASSIERPGWRRRNWELTVDTILECESRIPAAWKADPAWLKKLSWGMRQYYLQDFKLDRVSMKRNPGGFLGGLCRATVCEPSYLIRRLASGLAWDTDDMRNSQDFLRDLIRDWNVPWPPIPVESGCQGVDETIL